MYVCMSVCLCLCLSFCLFVPLSPSPAGNLKLVSMQWSGLSLARSAGVRTLEYGLTRERPTLIPRRSPPTRTHRRRTPARWAGMQMCVCVCSPVHLLTRACARMCACVCVSVHACSREHVGSLVLGFAHAYSYSPDSRASLDARWCTPPPLQTHNPHAHAKQVHAHTQSSLYLSLSLSLSLTHTHTHTHSLTHTHSKRSTPTHARAQTLTREHTHTRGGE